MHRTLHAADSDFISFYIISPAFWVNTMTLICKWCHESGGYIFPGNIEPEPVVSPDVAKLNLELEDNLKKRCEILGAVARVSGTAPADSTEEVPADEESPIAFQPQPTAPPLVVNELMIAVAEREASGWRAVADKLRSLKRQQEQQNPTKRLKRWFIGLHAMLITSALCARRSHASVRSVSAS